MKICTRCNVAKELTEYHKRSKSVDGVQPSCKACMAESYKRSRDAKIDHYRAVQAKREDRNHEKYKAWRETLECSLCDETETCCLDLHHLDPSEKDANIADVTRYWSWDKLMSEVDKCIVVCSNCHRKIHAGIIKL